MHFPGSLSREDAPQCAQLRARMDLFYQTTRDYEAFQHPNEMPEQWGYVRAAIEERLRTQPRCRVLEIGAGRSNFAVRLGDLRQRVEYTTQDVTRSNEDHLAVMADHVHFGSALEIEGRYDVIFSTFVLEHVSDPRRTLEKLFELLSEHGRLFIFCPRYDFPFYLPHSADHFGRARRLGTSLMLLAIRLGALVARRPLFLVHTDPAVFHMGCDRDRDAVHWVSLWDLEFFFQHRARLQRLKLQAGNFKDWVVKNFLQVNLCVSKD